MHEVSIKLGWDEQDFSEEENESMMEMAVFFVYIRHVFEHHKTARFLLPPQKCTDAVCTEDLKFTDETIDLIGLCSEEIQDLGQERFLAFLHNAFLVFHPKETIPEDEKVAEKNLMALEIIGEFEQRTENYETALRFIHNYHGTGHFSHENLKRYIEGKTLIPKETEGRKMFIAKVKTLQQKKIDKMEIAQLMEKENKKNKWLTEKEAVNLLLEIFCFAIKRPTRKQSENLSNQL